MSLQDESHPVLDSAPLGFPWATVDPFLFCAYHNDEYPEGTDSLGPAPELLKGRNLGMDFTVRNGFRMYHGENVPGFPQHPHRGFETVTFVRKGFCDHSDSLGAAARFGAGDAQWLTTGRGIVHSEMFPLLNKDKKNPLELFQIWLNLPSKNKMAAPHFSIFWSEEIPQIVETDSAGRKARVTLVAGRYAERKGPTPPPSSWAADPSHDVAIWTISLDANCSWTLPKTNETSTRALYFFDGQSLQVAREKFTEHRVMLLRPDVDVVLTAGPDGAQLLMLQGKPIEEPVVQHGPFVMNTQDEIRQAMLDYRNTAYGGWPWPTNDPDHGPEHGRFALRPSTEQEERPPAEK